MTADLPMFHEIVITQELNFNIHLDDNLVCSVENKSILFDKLFLMLRGFNGNHVQVKIDDWIIVDLEEYPEGFELERKRFDRLLKLSIKMNYRFSLQEIFFRILDVFLIGYSVCKPE